jgi:hypothetical protein
LAKEFGMAASSVFYIAKARGAGHSLPKQCSHHKTVQPTSVIRLASCSIAASRLTTEVPCPASASLSGPANAYMAAVTHQTCTDRLRSTSCTAVWWCATPSG